VSTHRYAARALAADYGRAGAGLALTVTPLALVEPAPAVGVSLGLLAALCAAFALRTLARQRIEIALDATGVSVAGSRRRRVLWRDLDHVSLAFYTTRRDRAKGWMQLSIAGANRRIEVDSTISDFPALVAASLAAANAKGLALSPRTLANAAELGVIDRSRAAA